MKKLTGILVLGIAVAMSAQVMAASSTSQKHRSAQSKHKSLTARQSAAEKKFQNQMLDLMNSLSTYRPSELALQDITEKSSLAGPSANSVATPTALGGGWGTAFLSVAGVNHWSTTNKRDGIAVAGMGFGNPNKYVGVTVAVNIGSIGLNDGGFADHGNLAVQINHYFRQQTALAFGVSNFAGWGASKNAPQSYYLVGTNVFNIGSQNRPLPLSISAGAGTGLFMPQGRNNNFSDNNIYPFAAMGLTVFPGYGVAVDWGRNVLNAGVTIQPIKKIPLSFSASANNLAGERNGSKYFWSFAVSYGITFGQG